MVAAMPALGKEHDELVFRRLTEQLNALPEPTVWQYDLGYYLFRALGDRFPDRAEKVFRDYLKPGTVGRRTTVILVLRHVRRSGDSTPRATPGRQAGVCPCC